MQETDFGPAIYDYVEETTAGDTVSVKTKDGAVWEQDVCEVHDENGGKIVCVTVGGSIPMMILETVTDDTVAHAYTYKNESYEHLGKIRTYGRESHAKYDDYDAEGWLDVDEFLGLIN